MLCCTRCSPDLFLWIRFAASLVLIRRVQHVSLCLFHNHSLLDKSVLRCLGANMSMFVFLACQHSSAITCCTHQCARWNRRPLTPHSNIKSICSFASLFSVFSVWLWQCTRQWCFADKQSSVTIKILWAAVEGRLLKSANLFYFLPFALP